MEVSYIPIAKARGFTTHWIKSLGMTQKEFSETFGIPMGTLRLWISGDRECPVYTKRMLAYMVELKRLEAKRNEE